MNLGVPASLKFTVPLILLGFAATLSTVNLLYHVPQAERAAEEDGRKRLAQEMSRLQSTMEYLVLKGDLDAAQHEIAVLAHNHDVTFAALTDERNVVITATRRAWVGRQIADMLPQFDLTQAAGAIRERRAGLAIDSNGDQLLGHAGILLGGEREELRPSRIGSVFLIYDLKRYKAEARAQVLQQSLYWAGWVTALALAMWLVFHFLLTRRTARLVHAAEQLAAGNIAARSGLKGTDELGRLSRAFDAMALEVAHTQTRLRQDIAERARSAEALRISEASYRAIFDAAEDSIFVHDLESGAIVDANSRACATFGYTREEFRQLDVGSLGTGEAPYTHQDAMGIIARAAAGEELRIEWLGKSKDGRLRWHEVFVRRVTIGGQDRVLALARDITRRKAAEAALRASEEQYRSMFNASTDGLALWNAAGEIVDTNPALWRMYGYGDGESPALPLACDTGPCYHTEFLKAVAAGQSLHSEVTDLRKDGSALELEVHGIPMQYQGKRHVLTIARDITEKKRSAEELTRQRESLYQREKLAALGSLLAGVAHELNNPLSVVVARAVLLEEQGDSATQTAALKIRTAAERCARIVRTFLAMARQQQPERGPVAVNDVVSAALDITAYAIRTSSIDVELELAKGMPLILADADQLHQVLLNLIINAQQSLQDQPAPRQIRVTSCFDSLAEVLCIRVADNGPGVPAHLRTRVFEPYFTTKPTGMGTGVGLAVSLGIVEAHGGTLTVDCPIEGGAVFTILLPVSTVKATGADAEPSWKPTASGRTILIVDDEAEIRDALAEILTGARHRVVTAGSGREALERMGEDHYDVILTDIRMPDLDGRALYQEIEQRWPGHAGRVVFVTGDTLTSALREFVCESGRPVIEKPFLPNEVRRIVDELAR
ncbi:MAG: PAS domain S-box protein [Betaproteobacteria bacterium]|nr:MAG: PAS domain S-box protein [Betaproteobacteria bacterium]